MADVKIFVGAKFSEDEWDAITDLHPEEYLEDKESKLEYAVTEYDDIEYVIGKCVADIDENTCSIKALHPKSIGATLQRVEVELTRIGLAKAAALYIIPDFFN